MFEVDSVIARMFLKNMEDLMLLDQPESSVAKVHQRYERRTCHLNLMTSKGDVRNEYVWIQDARTSTIRRL